MSDHRHCWHDAQVLLSNPPQYVLRCCWCGASHTERQRTALGHGRFLTQPLPIQKGSKDE